MDARTGIAHLPRVEEQDVQVNDPILLSAPDVGKLEEKALLDAFRSGWIAPVGPQVDELERRLAATTSRTHAVALSSGTAALHLALLALGVRAGDTVLTSSMTFAATANSITYTGARPVFVDSGADGNMDPELLAHAIEAERRTGHRVSAIVPVDLLGKIADYPAICEIAARYGVPVIADAAESLGAVRNGRPAGSFGVAAVVSFNGNKIVTTSGGGALLTDDPELARCARYLATQARQPVLHYEHTDIGFNYRMSNLLAGLGVAQLTRLPEMMERRRIHRVRYAGFFRDVRGVDMFGQPDGSVLQMGGEARTRDNFWLTCVLVDSAVTGWSARSLIEYLAAAHIEARPLWKPMHMQPVFAGRTAYVNGVSERLFEQGVCFPSGSALTPAQVKRVFDTLCRFLEGTPSPNR